MRKDTDAHDTVAELQQAHNRILAVMRPASDTVIFQSFEFVTRYHEPYCCY
jgi:hypothetical protein